MHVCTGHLTDLLVSSKCIVLTSLMSLSRMLSISTDAAAPSDDTPFCAGAPNSKVNLSLGVS